MRVITRNEEAYITNSQEFPLILASAGVTRGDGGRAQGVKRRNRRLNGVLGTWGHLG